MQGPRLLDRSAFVLTIAGLLVSAYLTYEHLTSSTTLACPETGTVNCAKVTTSSYADVVGIPVALLGLAFYAAITALALPMVRARVPHADRIRLGSVLVGVVFVGYLVWAELFRINAICLWCTAVHAITVVLFGVLAFSAAWVGDDR